MKNNCSRVSGNLFIIYGNKKVTMLFLFLIGNFFKYTNFITTLGYNLLITVFRRNATRVSVIIFSWNTISVLICFQL